jgi:hypothetical protein
MNIEIKCTCGFESRGGRDVVVSAMQAHCVSAHQTHVDEASILAKTRPVAEHRPQPLVVPGGTPSEHSNITALGLQTASWAVGVLARRAKRPAASRAAALLEQHLRSTAAKQRACAGGVVEVVEESPAGGAGGRPQQPAGSGAPAPKLPEGLDGMNDAARAQVKVAEHTMALRGMEAAINQWSGVKLGLGPHC